MMSKTTGGEKTIPTPNMGGINCCFPRSVLNDCEARFVQSCVVYNVMCEKQYWPFEHWCQCALNKVTCEGLFSNGNQMFDSNARTNKMMQHNENQKTNMMYVGFACFLGICIFSGRTRAVEYNCMNPRGTGFRKHASNECCNPKRHQWSSPIEICVTTMFYWITLGEDRVIHTLWVVFLQKVRVETSRDESTCIPKMTSFRSAQVTETYVKCNDTLYSKTEVTWFWDAFVFETEQLECQ